MKTKTIKLTFLILFFGAISLLSARKSEKVPFILAQNYFVRNDFPDNDLQMKRITSAEQLDAIFGTATRMGENGKPTTIDFSKSFAIAIINRVTNDIKSVDINSLTFGNNTLNIGYFISKSDIKSFSSRNFSLIIVDKKYFKNKLYANFNGENGEKMVGADFDEFGCKGSAGYVWSVLKNKCIGPGETDSVFDGASGKFGLLFNDNHLRAELIGFNYQNYESNLILSKNQKSKYWRNGAIKMRSSKDFYSLTDDDVVIAKARRKTSK